MLAMRTLAMCRTAAARQLPRALTGSRALRTLCAAAPLPGRRATQPSQPRGVSSGRALPQAAAVEAPTAASPAASAKGPANGAPTFQEAISRLQEYWASVGCALWLPHNTEVGMEAGTRESQACLCCCCLCCCGVAGCAISSCLAAAGGCL